MVESVDVEESGVALMLFDQSRTHFWKLEVDNISEVMVYERQYSGTVLPMSL